MCRKSKQKLSDSDEVVVVVYHVTFEAIGHGLLKKFCSIWVIGCVLRNAGSYLGKDEHGPLRVTVWWIPIQSFHNPET